MVCQETSSSAPMARRSDQLAKEHIQAALEGGFPTFEWLCRSIDNVDVPCEVSLARFPDPARRLVRGSIVDLTERRNAEASQAALERQLAQAQKLETIGQMTGGVAHDFNNLLSVIVGNLELLEETSIKDDQRELIQYAKNASLRGAALTRSMLNFARRANLSPETVSLSELVRGMESWMSRTIPANISVTTDVKPGLWSVVADVSGAESALLNLVINARDAMPNGGRLVIETENVTVDEITASATGNELQPGRYAMVAVSDTGQGILPEEIAKVFEPFFSTKDPSRNSGLGLSMVYGFMSQSEGDVRIYSEPGVGTTVKLFFPAREEVQSDRDCSDGSNVAELGKPARILVVEDQADVLTVLTRSLETLGHLIIRARDGDEAIGQLSKSGAVDLLITDVVMPGKLQGPELAKELRRSFPDLPVIFLSGYASDAAWHADGLERKDIQLMKPVARKELVAAVTRALGAGS